MNRHAKRSVITDDEIERVIRGKIYWKVPNQYEQVIKTINAGDPSANKSESEVGRAMYSWAEAVGGKPSDKAQPKKASKGFFSILGR